MCEEQSEYLGVEHLERKTDQMFFFRSSCEAELCSSLRVMTNLDTILKSRDSSLPTKVHLVKAMVFPVVMYECENWTIKKSEH